MCGRITQKSNPKVLGLKIATLVEPLFGAPPRYNGAPSQEHWVIRQHPETGERTLDRLTWGLIPGWIKEAVAQAQAHQRHRRAGGDGADVPRGLRQAALPAADRQLLRVEEDQGRKGQAALCHRHEERRAVRAGRHLGGWRHPETDEIVRTFCVITTDANELVADIHNRMPVILPPEAYDRWLSTDRARPARPAGPLSRRAHDDVADLDAGEQRVNDDASIWSGYPSGADPGGACMRPVFATAKSGIQDRP